jgi:hypothetical protein
VLLGHVLPSAGSKRAQVCTARRGRLLRTVYQTRAG